VTSAPGGRPILILQTINSVETPDLSTVETVVVVGAGEDDVPVVLPGTLQRYWYSTDQTTMYVLTVSGDYTGTTVDPASVTTHLTAIDLSTGAPWEEGSVAADGRIYTDFDSYYGQGVIVANQNIYLTTVVTESDGSTFTRTTILDRQTGAEVGFVDLEGTPTYYVVPTADEKHLLQVTESIDAAGEKRATLAVINPATATLVREPIAFDGALHTVLYTADSSHIVMVTQPGKLVTGGGGGPGGPYTQFSGPTTFTLVDTTTGAVVGDPLTIDSTFSNWTAKLGEDGDRAFALMYTRDDANVYTYTRYLLDIDGDTTAA
jgi:hypothetical protein